MSPRDLRAYDIYEGERVTLEFEGDIIVSGEIITGARNLQGKIILISFKDCTVTHKDTVLFRPEWGIYDMAVGKKIISAFSGPADVNSFDLVSHVPSSKTIKAKKSAQREALETLYQTVRDIREGKGQPAGITAVFANVQQNHPDDWLLCIEIAEVLHKAGDQALLDQVLAHLDAVKQNRPKVAHLIEGGLELIFEKESVN